MNNKRILIISSVPITHFGNLGVDRVVSLEELGYEVDYLTKYKDRDPHVIGIYRPRYIFSFFRNIRNLMPAKIVAVLRRLCPFLFPKKLHLSHEGIEVKSPDENCPLVDTETLLSFIQPIYSFVQILAWQDMITSVSIKAIYDKLHVPIVLVPVDFQPFTGGCFYFGNCRNFESGCGNCPVFKGCETNDNSKINFKIKKEVYKSINCGFMVNPYTMDFIKKSKIISENRLQVDYYSMDDTLYKPLDIQKCRQKLDISNKKYVILSRFSSLNNLRKGCQYLHEIINTFAEKIGHERINVLLLFAGGQDEDFEKKFNVDVLNVGTLSTDELVQAYSAADIFISTSIDDAGPSMVNQAIMCGTPVLSFNIGSALYMVDNGETGYRVPLLDTEAMSNYLIEHFNLTPDDRQNMKKKCRVKGLETCSRKRAAMNFINFATKLENLGNLEN